MKRVVEVKVDRPIGSYHPKHKEIYYSVNYGYVPNIIAGMEKNKTYIF